MKKFDKVFRIIGIVFCVLIVINFVSYAIIGCVSVHDPNAAEAIVNNAGS